MKGKEFLKGNALDTLQKKAERKEKPKRYTSSVCFDEETRLFASKMAKFRGLSISRYIESLVQEDMEKNKDLLDQFVQIEEERMKLIEQLSRDTD